MTKPLLYSAAIILSAILLWFVLANYRAAAPLAEENLRGSALSLAAAVESMARRDPTLDSLSTFQPPDVAFFALIDRQGRYRFHTNPDLIGSAAQGEIPRPGAHEAAMHLERRVVLGTGEKAYEFILPLHLPDEDLLLRLTLHTYRADAVVRRARFTLTLLLSLLATSWGLAVIILRLAAREERNRRELAQREGLARLGEMGAALAHEIRNPLAGIKGFAQWIEKRPADERNAMHAGRIVAEARRLEGLVNDLLSYARNDELRQTPIAAGELVSQALDLIRDEAKGLGVAIREVCPDGLVINGNRDRLHQLLLNLSRNALQAMPEGGELRVALRKGAGGIELSVGDSGEGIPAELVARLFEPFYTTKPRGTGLGLALCRKIAEEHGGMISVESAPGKGSVFTLTLPEA
ncbi:MAG: histidine kinase [Deltaproteobacteria bacterium]|nr:histidine kinase [Deltaproteobacteria bacterium]